ncbi:hypothetical protein cypCar_00035688, partial [Cyprinus carpio]
ETSGYCSTARETNDRRRLSHSATNYKDTANSFLYSLTWRQMTSNTTSPCPENRTQMKIVSGARSTARGPDHDQWTESASQEDQETRGTDEATAEAKR